MRFDLLDQEDPFGTDGNTAVAEEIHVVPGMEHIRVIDNDHVEVLVDGELENFSRTDVEHGMPGSGLSTFGPVSGDWRMIEIIAEDVAEAFRILGD
jgi:hypothetical protein